MKTTTKLTAIILLIAMVAVFMASCAGSADAKIVGSWKEESTQLIQTFKEDGTLVLSYDLAGAENFAISGTYKANGKVLNIDITVEGESQKGRSDYKIENDVLTITDPDGSQLVLKKMATMVDAGTAAASHDPNDGGDHEGHDHE